MKTTFLRKLRNKGLLYGAVDQCTAIAKTIKKLPSECVAANYIIKKWQELIRAVVNLWPSILILIH